IPRLPSGGFGKGGIWARLGRSAKRLRQSSTRRFREDKRSRRTAANTKGGSIMSKKTAAKPANVSQTIYHLLEISKLDTLYRDLYFQRAQELMDTVLPRSTYDGIKQKMASIDSVERQLRAAVERGEWDRSRTLTESIRTIKETAAASADGMRLGKDVYDGAADIPIDPFSRGLNVFIGGSAGKLGEWQDHAIKTLATLERADSSYSNKGFYARRGAD